MESFFGIGGPELLLILVLATVILGPVNMIKAARQLGILIRDLRNYYQSLTANLSQELGDLAELQETLRGEVNAAIPKPEELQVTVPDLMSEAQKVLDSPAPSQPVAESSVPVLDQEPGTPTPVQTQAGPSESPPPDQAVPVVSTADESSSQPQEPEQAQTAPPPADGLGDNP